MEAKQEEGGGQMNEGLCPNVIPYAANDYKGVFETMAYIFRDLLDEARDYHLMPERRPLLQSFKTKPRRCKDLAGVIYAVGGQTKSGNSLSTVEVSLRLSPCLCVCLFVPRYGVKPGWRTPAPVVRCSCWL